MAVKNAYRARERGPVRKTEDGEREDGAARAGRPSRRARTGGSLRSAKAPSARDLYADFVRELHDPDTQYYGPVRPIVTRSHSGVVGEFPSTKRLGPPLPYESQLELKSFLLKEADPEVRVFHAQPVTLLLGLPTAARRYTADVLVERWDGSLALEEVKPRKLLDDPEVAERHALAREEAARRGWTFVETTEDELCREPRLGNAQLLFRYSRHHVEPGTLDAAREVVRRVAPPTLGEMLRALAPLGAGMADALHMAARGLYDLDLGGAPLSEASGLRAPARQRRWFP